MKLKALLFVILLYYFWTATYGTNTFHLLCDYNSPDEYYNYLVDAFLDGHLHLNINPSPELLALADPYDPVLNNKVRKNDLVLYKNKYYLYFGPTPVVTLFLPYYLITKRHMPTDFAVFIFSFGSIIWLSALLLYLHRKYFHQIPESILLIGITVLAIANVAPFILQRPAIYEASISCGLFFLSGAMYWLICGSTGSSPSFWMLALGSLSMGLAVGCRTHLAVSGILLFLILMKLHKQNVFKSLIDFIKTNLIIFGPFIFCLFCLALYNYFRFGSIFESGASYQLCGENIRKIKLFGLSKIGENLFLYLFKFPITDPSFPYIYTKSVVGFLIGTPFVSVIFLAPFIYLTRYSYKDIFRNKKFYAFLFLFMATFLPACLILFFLTTFFFVQMRYIVDFISLFILASLIVWFYFDELLPAKSITKFVLRLVAIVLSIISILSGIAFGLSGEDQRLKNSNPVVYKKVELFFKPGEKFFNPPLVWEKIKQKTSLVSINVTSSKELNSSYSSKKAFDGLTNTDWASKGPGPVILQMVPKSPIKIRSLWFLSREEESMYKSWKKINVSLYLQGELVSVQNFSFSNSERQRIQNIELVPYLTDKIQLIFFAPVSLDLKGRARDVWALNPGYSEILLEEDR